MKTSAALLELRGMFTATAVAASIVLTLASVDLGLPAQDILESLRFHLAAAALVVPLLLLLVGAHWRAIGFLLVIVATAAHGGWIVYGQLALRVNNFVPTKSFQVLSFNVLANSEQGQNVADYMIGSGASLVAIMESPGIERSLERLMETFPYRVGCDRSETCDLSLFSRTPLSNATMHLFGPSRRERLITATTTIGGESVTMAALHLSKPYNDGAAAAELWQASHVLEQIEGPLIVAGDFNGSPWSSDIARFVRRNGLIPAPSYPATWPVRLGPFGIPIDNMFTRGGLQIETIAATEENFGSNHRGLVVRIGAAPN